MHIADLWEAIADAIPESPALIHGDVTRTWREFDDRSARLAAGFEARGVGAGTVVAVDLYNCAEWIEVFFAALKLRAVPANVNYRYVGAELRQVLTAAGAEVVVHHATLGDRIDSALDALPNVSTVVCVDDDGGRSVLPGAVDYEELIDAHEPHPRIERPDTDTFLAFTGGTTGLPKGVMFRIDMMVRTAITSRNLLFGIELPNDVDPLAAAKLLHESRSNPVAVPVSPLMHSTGLLYASVPALLAGGAVVTLEGRSFDPAELFAAIERTRASTVAIVGDAFAIPMVRTLTERSAGGEPYDLSSLRSICSAGAAWSADVKEALLRHIPQVVLSDSCGSTEGAFYGNRLVRAGQAPSTANFVAHPGVKVVDADRGPLPRGEIGYLASPTPASGYLNDPEATARTFYVEDGVQYVIPGDFGRVEPDGTFTLLGRGSTTINTGGEKVYPAEVEETLKAVDGVEDCLVFALPEPRFGQQVAAVIQPADGIVLDVDEVLVAARAHLAGYKVPRTVVLADVPRMANGKPDYKLAERLATRARG
jgi:fatty-acyl-CoA synthase